MSGLSPPHDKHPKLTPPMLIFNEAARAKRAETPEVEEIAWGRTTDKDRLFRVPETRDMLENLFTSFPSTATHNKFELLTLAFVLVQNLTFFGVLAWFGYFPLAWRVYFLVVFAAFRLSYNAGLGWLLKVQSDEKWFTNWCLNTAYFDKELASKSPASKSWYTWLKRELSLKMGSDYNFDTVPIEFNSWLLYRQLVDFVLINDFTAYMVFALSNFLLPTAAEFGIVDVLRYVGGVVLIAFNVWVKLDAHRVVKDFAWYWGEFFFVIDKNLVFDGVFEMIFHPMYSAGYSGFYGMSLITNSHAVLFVSLAAHAAQFLFLYIVEEPHIKKTYGGDDNSAVRSDYRTYEILYGRDSQQAYFRRDLIVFKNFDWFRSGDLLLAWSVCLTVFLAFPFPASTGIQIPSWLILILAVFWRLFHTYALGFSLRLQSQNKIWTKHFIKFGGSHRDAFSHWKGVYNFSLTMTYTTFIVAALKTFTFPASWVGLFAGPFILRQVLGSLLVFFHCWMSVSVFEVLGDFGWFYGDFFIDEFPAELHYTGIYRFLNNPEKILGNAAFWGFALMSGNGYMYALAVFSHLSTWWFLEYIESPHMKKLYGAKIRKESGLEKTIRKNLANPVTLQLEKQKVVADVNKVLVDINKIGVDVASKVEKLVAQNVTEMFKSEVDKVMEVAKPAIEELLHDTRAMLADTTARLTSIGNAELGEEGLKNLAEYGLHFPESLKKPVFGLGEPIRLYWTAPMSHAPQDWIGIYKITANPSGSVTTVSSKGKWKHVGGPGETEGQIVFSGDALPWEVGVYEMRYHFNDKHLVLVKSDIFEIKVESFPVLEDSFVLPDAFSPTVTYEDLEASDLDPITPNYELYVSMTGSPRLPPSHPNSFEMISSKLLPLYRRALDLPTVQPLQHFTLDLHGSEVHARRIAYAVKLMYGVEFSWKVVMHLEPSVERMVERIQEARVVLAPSSWDMQDDSAPSTVSSSEYRALSISRQMQLLQAEKEARRRDKRRLKRILKRNGDGPGDWSESETQSDADSGQRSKATSNAAE